MRVLDIDLDFFLADCCPLAPFGQRPQLKGHEPWEAERVDLFLRNNCGLDPRMPLPGRIFETHDGALQFWQERIREGTLKKPFTVTHVDAHSDLGIGYPGPDAVLSGVLPIAFPKREDISLYYERRQLDESNYLLFAIALRYIDKLENVRNLRSRKDLPRSIFDPDTGDIRLTSFASRFLEEINGPEPAVPYIEYPDHRSFRAEAPYDFMTVAVSPRYSPAEADALLPVFAGYMRQI